MQHKGRAAGEVQQEQRRGGGMGDGIRISRHRFMESLNVNQIIIIIVKELQ